MNQRRLAVHADMRRHPAIPQGTRLDLVHLRIPHLLSRHCRAGHRDAARIFDGPTAHLYAVFCPILPDPYKEQCPDLVGLHERPNRADGGRIWHELRVESADTQILLTRAKLYRAQLQGHLAKNDFGQACMLGLKEACRELP